MSLCRFEQEISLEFKLTPRHQNYLGKQLGFYGFICLNLQLSYVKALVIKLIGFYVDFAKKLRRKSEIIRVVNLGQHWMLMEVMLFDWF